MNEERKPQVWPWIVASAMLLPVLYLLSLGPIVWCQGHGLIPLSPQTLQIYYDPSNYFADHAPAPIVKALQSYICFFSVDPPPPSKPRGRI